MKHIFFKRLIIFLITLSLSISTNVSADNEQATKEWHSYIEPILSLGGNTALLVTDTEDAQLRQEVYRQLFSGMSMAYTGLFLGDDEHPDYWPLFNMAYNFWGTNPDAVYYLAPVDGNGVYRISGFRGSVRLIDIQIGSGGFFPHGDSTPGPNVGNFDLDNLHINEDGSFEVVLSKKQPHDYQGDWWELDSKATYILVRQVAYDWINEVDGRFAIDRIDRPAIKPRQSADYIDSNLRQIPKWSENWTRLSAQWVINYKNNGPVNTVTVRNWAEVGGVTDQKYIEGLFLLKPDEALIYETEIPDHCRYWNAALTDMLMRGIDFMNRQTSLNGYTANLDSDGKFRAVISAIDPGVPNWLDTAGYAKGGVTGRWTQCSSYPTPKLTKLKLKDVRKYLPADTPVVTADDRDASIRLRRKGAQLRRRW